MAPLIVMLVTSAVARLAGEVVQWSVVNTWAGALRTGLAVMFLFTALAHFHPRTRPDLVRMVPRVLPHAALLVTITGVLELLGAVGLLVPWATAAAAYALSALLVALFPANVHAAREELSIAGRRAMRLPWRILLQLFWIGALWWVGSSAA